MSHYQIIFHIFLTNNLFINNMLASFKFFISELGINTINSFKLTLEELRNFLLRDMFKFIILNINIVC